MHTMLSNTHNLRHMVWSLFAPLMCCSGLCEVLLLLGYEDIMVPKTQHLNLKVLRATLSHFQHTHVLRHRALECHWHGQQLVFQGRLMRDFECESDTESAFAGEPGEEDFRCCNFRLRWGWGLGKLRSLRCLSGEPKPRNSPRPPRWCKAFVWG